MSALLGSAKHGKHLECSPETRPRLLMHAHSDLRPMDVGLNISVAQIQLRVERVQRADLCHCLQSVAGTLGRLRQLFAHSVKAMVHILIQQAEEQA